MAHTPSIPANWLINNAKTQSSFVYDICAKFEFFTIKRGRNILIYLYERHDMMRFIGLVRDNVLYVDQHGTPPFKIDTKYGGLVMSTEDLYQDTLSDLKCLIDNMLLIVKKPNFNAFTLQDYVKEDIKRFIAREYINQFPYRNFRDCLEEENRIMSDYRDELSRYLDDSIRKLYYDTINDHIDFRKITENIPLDALQERHASNKYAEEQKKALKNNCSEIISFLSLFYSLKENEQIKITTNKSVFNTTTGKNTKVRYCVNGTSDINPSEFNIYAPDPNAISNRSYDFAHIKEISHVLKDGTKRVLYKK